MSDATPAALEHPLLASVALSYAPVIDRQRNITATRLTLTPLRADAQHDHAELLSVLAATWPEGGVWLSPKGEALLVELLSSPPAKPSNLEVPAFIAADADRADSLIALKQAGHNLMLSGVPNAPLPAAVQAVFKQLVLDPSSPATVPPGSAFIHAPVLGANAIEASFKAGAQAVIGWPMDGRYTVPEGSAKTEVAADLQVIVELMSRVDQGEDIERLEQTLKRDPSLAFKLLRFLNSAAFGLPVEVTSFRHAIMLLGYPRLKRWLALLLTTASKDHTMRPVMYGALRRGLVLEELARGLSDREMRDELFICGLFSLLDHMLRAPFEKLLQSIPVPERVRQALAEEAGPFAPYLQLVEAVEAGNTFEIRERADALMISVADVNASVLRALYKAAQLE